MSVVSTTPATDHLLDQLEAGLRALAAGAVAKMHEHHAKPDRERDIPRWGETYWSGYLHGLCAAIAKITGQDELTVALEYEVLGP